MGRLEGQLARDAARADALRPPDVIPLKEREFERFRHFIHERAGISLAPHKRQMVSARLQRRLHHLGLHSFDAYLDRVFEPDQDQERQHLVDLLTTNETYFYREPAHFEYLREQVLPTYHGLGLRLWSAACSTGEEVYTLAMVLADALGPGDWHILGTDISQRVLEQARQGVYPLERARHLPRPWLERYCLKGVRAQAGNLLIDPKLKSRVTLKQHNLLQPRRDGESFDIIFLRNVLIYFDPPTKQRVIDRLFASLRPGGLLFISHVESLHGLDTPLIMIRPSIFQRPSTQRGAP
ncbi:CheR family methyltransferase [Allochromatium vinosum]|uniref:Chemotaxis protein methyltransferase n=1 Tax=Allochromatium vinosum (strain ATCC 17899 / DSM 180 / NBRC 103801 / NCIMB 10441 / D) TaxID=572477 RepID=D3RTK0_ALLVD|nr:protein-glutamate O-methyltransferase CheR [Allochromatium vinosum]ADC62509.1 MCP methyltransferase, CheR-type [Allochromatium vinosum DSM 180]